MILLINQLHIYKLSHIYLSPEAIGISRLSSGKPGIKNPKNPVNPV
jgi:hypothetical protein